MRELTDFASEHQLQLDKSKEKLGGDWMTAIGCSL